MTKVIKFKTELEKQNELIREKILRVIELLIEQEEIND